MTNLILIWIFDVATSWKDLDGLGDTTCRKPKGKKLWTRELAEHHGGSLLTKHT